MERSLVLVKPDAVERNLVGTIIQIYENAGLKVKALKMEKITEEFSKKHYEEHIGKNFFGELVQYITRSPLVAMVLEGEKAIELIRSLNGATDPSKAVKDTIRERFAISKTENSIHASDCLESANREIKLWFPEF